MNSRKVIADIRQLLRKSKYKITAIVLVMAGFNGLLGGYGITPVQAIKAEEGWIRFTNNLTDMVKYDLSKNTNRISYIKQSNILLMAASGIAYFEQLGIDDRALIQSLQTQGITVVLGEAQGMPVKGWDSIQVIDFKPVKELYPNLDKEASTRIQEVYDILTAYYTTTADTQEEIEGDGVVFYPPFKESWWRDTITSHFGDRDSLEINSELNQVVMSDKHAGLDIGMGPGVEIYPIAEGRVIAAESLDWGLGNYITIAHKGYISTYGHCEELRVEEGDYVDGSKPIATVGSSGWSTGWHLHLEVLRQGKLIDPLSLYIDTSLLDPDKQN